MAVNTIQELINLLNEIDSDAQSLQYITNDAADSTAHGPSAGLVTTRSGTNVKNVRKVIQDVEDGITTGIRPNIQDEGSTVIYGAGAINFIGGAVTVTDVGGTATVDISSSVTTIGTPTDNQIGVWTGSGTLEGDSDFVWDGSNLGIGTSSPAKPLHLISSTAELAIGESGTNQRLVLGYQAFPAASSGGSQILADGTNLQYFTRDGFGGAHIFHTGSTSAERMRLNNSGNLGLGTSSPSKKLHVSSTAEAALFTGTATWGSAIQLEATATGGRTWQIQATANGAGEGGESFLIADKTAAATRLLIDQNGNVGIGTTSPALQSGGTGLHIHDASNSELKFTNSTTGSGGSQGTALLTSSSNFILNNREAGAMLFQTSNTEHMRLDSSGNVLIGKSSSAIGTQGVDLRADGQNYFVRDGGTPIFINRLTSDGTLVDIRKDSTTVGSIGAESGRIFVFGNTTYSSGLRFENNAIVPANSSGTGRDNLTDLGSTSFRYDDVYATNGTIQTSDRNEKQQISDLTEAEIEAAKALSKLFKTFKWNDSVDEKGDDARIHSGVIAQDVEDVMNDVGLDANNYAFFVSTIWYEDDAGNTYQTIDESPENAVERERKGIRYPQLLSFISAATEKRLASIEERLAALESA